MSSSSDAATERREGTTLRIVDSFVPTAKQVEFFRACDDPGAQDILFDGSIRGGKSQACCKKIVDWAMRYGGRYIVSRATYRELEDSTKKIMLYGEGGMPPALPPQLIATRRDGSQNISAEHNTVTLVNGAEILFRSLEPDQRGKIRNISLNGIFIDQIEELEDADIEEFYQELLGRLSDPRGPRKLIAAANPGPEDHWVHKRFIDPRYRKLHPKARRVHVSILDNARYLHPEYVRDLLATEHTQPGYFSRMVMGEWGFIGGKRFKVWQPALHVVDRVFDIPSGWEIVEGLDYGWTNPFVSLSVAIDYDGRHWVVGEHYASELRISQHAAAIKAQRANDGGMLGFQGQLEPSACYLDPSAWNKRGEYESAAHELLEHGILCSKAVNDRLGGWNRMDEYLATTLADGLPRLRFFPTCENVIREIPNLRIKPGTDDVEKVNDHAADALRYVLMSRFPGPEEPTKEEAHTREAVMARSIARHQGRQEQLERELVQVG